jgi:glutathione S-transferase
LETIMAGYKLVSFNLCPFVQRSVITLEERGVAYDIEYIDLADKPEWFNRISPFGKVPLLQVGDTVLFESAVINEYIDETAPGRSMLPADPLAKARHRAWIEFGSVMAGDAFRWQMAKDEGSFDEHGAVLKDRLGRLEGQVKGPYFAGDSFGLVDAAIAPVLQRIRWCEAITPRAQLLRGFPRVDAWTAALMERPAVRRSTIDGIVDVFLEYLRGRGSPSRNVDPAWLGRQAV